jgi:hypothetical protein
MRLTHATTALLFAFASALTPAFAANDLIQDQPMTIAGVETVCTGVGLEARQDPRWRAFPLVIEFVGKAGQYLGDDTVTVTGQGQNVSVHCAGPWIAMKLPAGSYHIAADVAEGGHNEMTANIGAKGQAHAIIRYPNAGGEEMPARVASQ